MSSCHSTNAVASEIAQNTLIEEGAIVIANEQTHGRGQRGNVWQSAPGMNLTFSIVLYPNSENIDEPFALNMAVSLGINDYLLGIDEAFKIKWPNDIYRKEKKAGGILIQNAWKGHSWDYAIVGIGLNVNQTDFEYPKAMAIGTVAGNHLNLQNVLEGVCLGIERRYTALREGKRLKPDYMANLLGYRQMRNYRNNKNGEIFRAQITDITRRGKLILENEQHRKEFDLKEVEFR